MHTLFVFSLLVLGFVVLTYAAKLLCDTSLYVAHRFHISPLIVGLFLVSFGTAAPDCMTAVIATLENNPDISIGNILGSNFANLALGFGVAGTLFGFHCVKDVARLEFPLLFFVTVIFVAICCDGYLSRAEGGLFFLLFLIYAFYVLYKQKGKALDLPEVDEAVMKRPLWVNGVFFLVSLGLLTAGAHLVVDSCRQLADIYNLSHTFIGFSVLAFGTSAPEIFIVAMAAKKKQYSICAGNIIGSNLINLMFIPGLCALIRPMVFPKNIFVIEAVALILLTGLAWYIFSRQKVFSKKCGVAFLVIYLVTLFLAQYR